MIFQTTTIERLFPTALSRRALISATNFGFESRGKRYFDVTVPGKPRIEQGMTVIALLEKSDAWESGGLLGWIDCADGTIVCESYIKWFGITLLYAFWSVMAPLSAYSHFKNSENVDLIAIFLATVFGVITLRLLYLSIKAMLIKKALLEVRMLFYNQANIKGYLGG